MSVSGSPEKSSEAVSPIRLASMADVDGIAALSAQLGYRARADDVARLLAAIADDPDHAVLIATDGDGGIVGWVHVFVTHRIYVEPFAELGGMVVEQSQRRTGIGRTLLQSAEQWARTARCSLLRVRTNTARGAAHDFYREMGYVVSKEQRIFDKWL